MRKIFADDLQAFAGEGWQIYLEHPFFTALGEGTLGLDALRFWLEQDLPYIADYGFARNAVARKLPADPRYADLAEAATGDVWREHPGSQEATFELDLLEMLGVSPGPIERFAAKRAREGYMNHIVRVAHEGSVGEILAALLPCEWGFAEIGRRLDASRAPDLDPIFAKWIDYYVSENQAENTRTSLAILERAADLADHEEHQRMRWIFRRSVQHQIEVLDAAWQTEDLWPDERARETTLLTGS